MSVQQAGATSYFIPGPSQWPVMAGAALLVAMLGAEYDHILSAGDRT